MMKLVAIYASYQGPRIFEGAIHALKDEKPAGMCKSTLSARSKAHIYRHRHRQLDLRVMPTCSQMQTNMISVNTYNPTNAKVPFSLYIRICLSICWFFCDFVLIVWCRYGMLNLDSCIYLWPVYICDDV